MFSSYCDETLSQVSSYQYSDQQDDQEISAEYFLQEVPDFIQITKEDDSSITQWGTEEQAQNIEMQLNFDESTVQIEQDTVSSQGQSQPVRQGSVENSSNSDSSDNKATQNSQSNNEDKIILRYGQKQVDDQEAKARVTCQARVDRIREQGNMDKIRNAAQHRWSQEDQRIFEIVVACIGVRDCNARKIQEIARLGVQLQKYQDHKDTYWRRVRKANNLGNNSSEIKNWMYDTKSKNADVLKEICSHWKVEGFKSFSPEQIAHYLNFNQQSEYNCEKEFDLDLLQ